MGPRALLFALDENEPFLFTAFYKDSSSRFPYLPALAFVHGNGADCDFASGCRIS
jgi:hypothetical protein